jgi:hypothetical protein
VRLNKRERVKLLAATYQDACEGGNDGASSSRAGARIPSRNAELWHAGSYAEFESACNLLRVSARKQHGWFWRVYVIGDDHGMSVPHKKHWAEQALTFVLKRMEQLGGGNIFVPMEVSENAGYSQAEAKSARRPMRQAA